METKSNTEAYKNLFMPGNLLPFRITILSRFYILRNRFRYFIYAIVAGIDTTSPPFRNPILAYSLHS